MKEKHFLKKRWKIKSLMSLPISDTEKNMMLKKSKRVLMNEIDQSVWKREKTAKNTIKLAIIHLGLLSALMVVSSVITISPMAIVGIIAMIASSFCPLLGIQIYHGRQIEQKKILVSDIDVALTSLEEKYKWMSLQKKKERILEIQRKLAMERANRNFVENHTESKFILSEPCFALSKTL